MSYRSICDLSPEIIHPIFLQLRQGTKDLRPIDLIGGNINLISNTIRNCSLTCKYLRDLAVEHIPHKYYRLSDQESVDAFIHFLRKHPRVAPTIEKFVISTPAGADPIVLIEAVIAEMVKDMSRLQELHLSGVRLCSAAHSSDATSSGRELEATSELRAPEPAKPTSLPYFLLHESRFSLTALCRVLALFDIGSCLLQDLVRDWDTPDTEPNHLTRSIRIHTLTLDTDGDTTILEVLSEHLATGHLQGLCVPRIVSPDDTRAVGVLLSGPGREISDLRLGNQSWSNRPLNQWQALRINFCASSQHFNLDLFFRPDFPDETWDLTPIVPIFAHAASSLRLVELHLHNLADYLAAPEQFGSCEHLQRKLAPIDAVLADDRIAQPAQVWVYAWVPLAPDVVKQLVFPRLHQKNILKWFFY